MLTSCITHPLAVWRRHDEEPVRSAREHDKGSSALRHAPAADGACLHAFPWADSSRREGEATVQSVRRRHSQPAAQAAMFSFASWLRSRRVTDRHRPLSDGLYLRSSKFSSYPSSSCLRRRRTSLSGASTGMAHTWMAVSPSSPSWMAITCLGSSWLVSSRRDESSACGLVCSLSA